MKRIIPILFVALALFTACDKDDDNRVAVNDAIETFIEAEYPGSSIRKAEYEDNGLLEVEFIHNSIRKDAYFNSNNEWVYTKWDVAIASLPQSVVDAASTMFPNYKIDDADYIEHPDGECYKLELERGNIEQVLFVTPDGNVLES